MTSLIVSALIAGLAAGAWVRRQRYRPRSFTNYFAAFKPMVASHRGFGKHGPIAENTIAAFLASEKLGFRGHELDVRRTKDNVLILFHGPRLEDSTDGSGLVEDRLYGEIGALNAAHYLTHQAKGKRTLPASLPKLTEMLAAIKQVSLVNVEIKRDRWDLSRGLEELTLADVDTAGATDRVFFSGFHFLTLWRLRRRKTRIPVGLLIEPGRCARFKLWLYRTILLPDNIHLHYSTASAELVRKLKKAGYGVACWTVNEIDLARSLFASGVDIVITDNMDFAQAFSDKAAKRKS